jgi:hypothetical protein
MIPKEETTVIKFCDKKVKDFRYREKIHTLRTN